MYQCERCKKIFKQKNDHHRHINRKNPCAIRGKMAEKGNPNDKELIKIMSDKINIMSDQMMVLVDRLAKIENNKSIDEQKNVTINNNMTGDVVNGNVVKGDVINCQVNLVSFGKENLTVLTDDQVKDILNNGLKGPLKYAEIVHCNTYKNIYVSNKKSTDVTVYNDDKWELQGKEYIDKVRDNGIEFMEEQYEERKNDLPKYIVSKMTKFTNHMTSENAESIKDGMSKDIRLLFYNKRPAANEKNK